jgi:hypothetical protein
MPSRERSAKERADMELHKRMVEELPDKLPSHLKGPPHPAKNLFSGALYQQGRIQNDPVTGKPYQHENWGKGGNVSRKEEAEENALRLIKKYGARLKGQAAYIAAVEGISERTVYRCYRKFGQK